MRPVRRTVIPGADEVVLLIGHSPVDLPSSFPAWFIALAVRSISAAVAIGASKHARAIGNLAS